MQVIVDKLLTAYDKSGSGPVVLLLHGWGDNRQSFKTLRNELDKSYQVINLDLPGFGQSQAPNEPWNLDNYADFVSRFLKKIQIDTPLAVLGHSNGGAIAIKGLSTGKFKADKLILLASAGMRSGQKLKKSLLKATAKTGRIATFWLPQSQRQKLRQRLYGAAGSDMMVAPQLEETFKLIVQQDIQDDARRLTLPALLIYGSSDTAVPIKSGQRLAKLIPKSQLIELPAAGHFVHQEAPTEVLGYIKDFLAK